MAIKKCKYNSYSFMESNRCSLTQKLNFCKLCLIEKVFIINALNDSQLLIKKSKLINTCHPQNKLLIKCLEKNNKRHDSTD